MIDEDGKGKVIMTWKFSKWQWEQLEELAHSLDYGDADQMFQDVTMGFLQKHGIDPMKWI